MLIREHRIRVGDPEVSAGWIIRSFIEAFPVG
jgi:hypothetical protein